MGRQLYKIVTTLSNEAQPIGDGTASCAVVAVGESNNSNAIVESAVRHLFQ